MILLVNLIFLIWIIAGAASTSGHATDCGTLTQETCDNARDVGAGIGIGIIIFLWAAADVILGIVWLMTRPNKRHCPVCGSNVRKRPDRMCRLRLRLPPGASPSPTRSAALS